MSKERAQRRAEREAASAALAARREAEARRAARRAARRRALTGWLPRSSGRHQGLLADRTHRQVLATALMLVVLNLIVFALARDPAISGLLLVASVLGFPIVHLLIFRRTT